MGKLTLKKKVRNSLILFIIIIIGIIFGINKYKEYKYHQTNEYKLTLKGYTLEEAKVIIKTLDNDNEKYFVDNDKIDFIVNLLKEKYFMEKNLQEYLEYKNDNKDLELSEVVAIVNVHANRSWYDENAIKPTDMTKGNLILVNKFNYLKSDFIPEDLTSISLSYAYSGNKVTKETNDAYLEMAKAAKQAGIQLLANSAYRDYEKQESVYKDYYYSKGVSYADKYAARAGYSEHQTGLSIDIFTNGATTKTFESTEAYIWLINNSYKYGFILRYPKDKEYLTGYEYESWHYRYLGVTEATKVYNSGLTYDEYYAYYLE